jgi:hypothetical protein
MARLLRCNTKLRAPKTRVNAAKNHRENVRGGLMNATARSISARSKAMLHAPPG